jgi:16S rRNA (adenine1518-N6/adenine1519-N6)-dimethyltransferase
MLPKKSLGQNFLTSIPARMAIVEAGHLTTDDTVLEIGPGKGFLTRAILDSGAHVVALEKDRDLIPVLEETFAEEIKNKKITLIEGDALIFSPEEAKLKDGKWKLIANIPYYITGAILSRYLSGTCQPSMMVVLVQKEVAERACARDGKESLLSLSIKVYGDPKLVYRVSRGSFNPIPSVDSAVLQIRNISRTRFKNQYHEQMFFQTIKAGFAHKRKFLLSNLKEKIPTTNWLELFTKHSINEKVRAEDLTLDTWLLLSQL